MRLTALCDSDASPIRKQSKIAGVRGKKMRGAGNKKTSVPSHLSVCGGEGVGGEVAFPLKREQFGKKRYSNGFGQGSGFDQNAILNQFACLGTASNSCWKGKE